MIFMIIVMYGYTKTHTHLMHFSIWGFSIGDPSLLLPYWGAMWEGGVPQWDVESLGVMGWGLVGLGNSSAAAAAAALVIARARVLPGPRPVGPIWVHSGLGPARARAGAGPSSQNQVGFLENWACSR